MGNQFGQLCHMFLEEIDMKLIITLLFAFLLVPRVHAQTAEIKPTEVKFKFYNTTGIFTTTFMVNDEKIVYNLEFSPSQKEMITISSPSLKARSYPIGHDERNATGFPDSYNIADGQWKQSEPTVSAPVPEKYKEYLRIARRLSLQNWPTIDIPRPPAVPK